MYCVFVIFFRIKILFRKIIAFALLESIRFILYFLIIYKNKRYKIKLFEYKNKTLDLK